MGPEERGEGLRLPPFPSAQPLPPPLSSGESLGVEQKLKRCAVRRPESSSLANCPLTSFSRSFLTIKRRAGERNTELED